MTNQVDKEIEELLRLYPVVPKKKKASPPKLAVVGSTKPPLEALRKSADTARERLFTAEMEELAKPLDEPLAKPPSGPLVNKRRYGSAMPPTVEQRKAQKVQDYYDHRLGDIKRAKWEMRQFKRQANEFGHHGQETLAETVQRQDERYGHR